MEKDIKTLDKQKTSEQLYALKYDILNHIGRYAGRYDHSLDYITMKEFIGKKFDEYIEKILKN